MTSRFYWVLIICSIVVFIGVGAYISKASILSHYQKFIDAAVETRTAEITKTYDEQKKVLQEQIYNKQLEINKKDALIRTKEKRIKESEVKVTLLQTENNRLQRLIDSIALPTSNEEIRKRLKELGYEICK